MTIETVGDKGPVKRRVDPHDDRLFARLADLYASKVVQSEQSLRKPAPHALASLVPGYFNTQEQSMLRGFEEAMQDCAEHAAAILRASA